MLTDQQITEQLQSGTAALESVPVAEIKSGDYVRYPDADDPTGRTYRRVSSVFVSKARASERSKRLDVGRKLVFVDGWNKTSDRLMRGHLVERVAFGVGA